MKRFIILGLFTGIMLSVIFFNTGFAEKSGNQDAPEDRRMVGKNHDLSERPDFNHDRESLKEKREHFRIAKAYRLISFLDMDEETSIKFLPIYHSQEKAREKIRDKKIKQFRLLHTALEKEDTPEKELKKMYDEFLKLEKESIKSRDLFRKKTAKVLSLRQMIKLGVFEHRFRENIKSMFMSRRRRMSDIKPEPEPKK